MTRDEAATLRDLLQLTNAVNDNVSELRRDMMVRLDSHEERIRTVESFAIDLRAHEVADAAAGVSRRFVITTVLAAIAAIVAMTNVVVPVVLRVFLH